MPTSFRRYVSDLIRDQLTAHGSDKEREFLLYVLSSWRYKHNTRSFGTSHPRDVGTQPSHDPYFHL